MQFLVILKISKLSLIYFQILNLDVFSYRMYKISTIDKNLNPQWLLCAEVSEVTEVLKWQK